MKKKSLGLISLLKLVWPQKSLFFLAMVALAAGSGINLLLPEVLRRLLNDDNIQYIIQEPILTASFLVGLFALQGICFYFRTYLFGIIGLKAVRSLRRDLYANVIQQPMSFFDTHRVGELLSRITADTEMVREAVSIKLSVFIRYTIQVIGGIVLMMLISVELTIILALILPIIIGLSVFLGRKLKKLSKVQQQELARASTVAEETIAGARIVHAFNQVGTETKRFDKAVQNVLTTGLSRTAVAAFFSSFVSFLMNAAIVVVLIYGSTLIVQDQLNIGDLTAFFLYGIIVAVSFSFIAGGIGEFATALGATETLFELLEREREEGLIGPTDRASKDQETQPAQVTFSDVSFAYPTRKESDVLKDISFTIEPGQKVALVGPSGSGKSTIVNLLLRFYKPRRGTISLSGKDLNTLSPYELRDQIGFVPQDPQLFAISIADNLQYGKRSASMDEIRDACEQASILSFIEQLPKKFDTFVGERGVQLSGGQKQRLAIARAILRNPQLLILDEATSSLDSENEHLIQSALEKLMMKRSSLVIAHRLSTIRDADLVLVLKDGQIVQRGTHEELSTIEGLYKVLVERQELTE